MKIVTAAQMRAIDKRSIEEYEVPGIILMENAGCGVVNAIKENFGDVLNQNIIIICGTGNNGGDGFVIARHLIKLGANVWVFLIGSEEKIKGDALINWKILKHLPRKVIYITQEEELTQLPSALEKSDLIVDALLGTGITGEIRDLVKAIIELVNAYDTPIVSVDLPSGLNTDTGQSNTCIQATFTTTMCLPKLGLFLYPGRTYAGDIIVVDISAPNAAINEENIKTEILLSEEAKLLFPYRKANVHKGNCGRILILAGAEGFTGAAILTAKAALRGGAGLVTVGIPESLNPILEIKLTEVMTLPLKETVSHTLALASESEIKNFLKNHKIDVLAIGPGLTQERETTELVRRLLANVDLPIVLDADGLNALIGHQELLSKIHEKVILTPHAGEMARLLDCSIEEIIENPMKYAEKAAKEWQVTILLKGATSIIVSPEGEITLNLTGNAGMATGGSGDVLTGIIASLLGQGCNTYNAARLGAYIHGLTGDLTAEIIGETGLIASDLIRNLPEAIKSLID